MNCPKTLLAAGLMIFAAVNSPAVEVKVIANSSVKADTISAAELKLVFLEVKNSLADGSHVEPVLEKDGPVNAAFLQQYMGVSEDDLHDYYRTLVFTGRGAMPKTLDSDSDVVAYVSRTRGAIGYVSIGAGTEGVKTLAIDIPASRGERTLIVRVVPDYPETLRRLNIGGTVRFRISISAKGNVQTVELLGGNPILAEAAALAVKKWVYAAGPSRTTAEVTVSFDIR